MRSDLSISYTETSGAKKTSKLNYVNPDATEGQLAGLLDRIIAMTDNTLTAANKVTTESVQITETAIPVKLCLNGTQEKHTEEISYDSIYEDEGQRTYKTIRAYYTPEGGEPFSEYYPLTNVNFELENNTVLAVSLAKELPPEPEPTANDIYLAINIPNFDRNKTLTPNTGEIKVKINDSKVYDVNGGITITITREE